MTYKSLLESTNLSWKQEISWILGFEEVFVRFCERNNSSGKEKDVKKYISLDIFPAYRKMQMRKQNKL